MQIASIGIDLGKTTFHLVWESAARFYFVRSARVRSCWPILGTFLHRRSAWKRVRERTFLGPDCESKGTMYA